MKEENEKVRAVLRELNLVFSYHQIAKRIGLTPSAVLRASVSGRMRPRNRAALAQLYVDAKREIEVAKAVFES